VRKGFAFPYVPKQSAARLSLARPFFISTIGKAQPYRTGCGKAAVRSGGGNPFVGFITAIFLQSTPVIAIKWQLDDGS